MADTHCDQNCSICSNICYYTWMGNFCDKSDEDIFRKTLIDHPQVYYYYRNSIQNILAGACLSYFIIGKSQKKIKLKMIEIILQYDKTDIVNQVTDKPYRDTALMKAVTLQDGIELAKLLLKYGAKIYIDKETPHSLFWTIFQYTEDKYDLAKLLLDQNQDPHVNDVDALGLTPLEGVFYSPKIADTEQIEKILKLLFSKGALVTDKIADHPIIINFALTAFLPADIDRKSRKTPLNRFFDDKLYDKNVLFEVKRFFT